MPRIEKTMCRGAVVYKQRLVILVVLAILSAAALAAEVRFQSIDLNDKLCYAGNAISFFGGKVGMIVEGVTKVVVDYLYLN